MDQNNTDILARCRKGDRKAQKELYDLYSPALYSLCLRYMGNRQQAEDILHDGFITIFEHIGDLNNETSMRAWMNSIMIHAALKSIRRQAKLQIVANDETLNSSPHPDSVDINYNNYDIQIILSAINRLPLYMRTIFNMHDVEGYTYQEIAHTLGIKETTARGYLFRAKEILKQELAHFREQ